MGKVIELHKFHRKDLPEGALSEDQSYDYLENLLDRFHEVFKDVERYQWSRVGAKTLPALRDEVYLLHSDLALFDYQRAKAARQQKLDHLDVLDRQQIKLNDDFLAFARQCDTNMLSSFWDVQDRDEEKNKPISYRVHQAFLSVAVFPWMASVAATEVFSAPPSSAQAVMYGTMAVGASLIVSKEKENLKKLWGRGAALFAPRKPSVESVPLEPDERVISLVEWKRSNGPS